MCVVYRDVKCTETQCCMKWNFFIYIKTLLVVFQVEKKINFRYLRARSMLFPNLNLCNLASYAKWIYVYITLATIIRKI
jgi:hypothetical protein